MKKVFYILGLAALALASCTIDETYVNPNVPRVDKPMPVITYEGSGNLVTGAIDKQKQLKSTYSWEAKDNTITINIGFDLEEYIDGGGWELGYFFLDLDSINDYLGILVTSDTDESNFYGVDPDGTKCDWTSYKPGMWINADGSHSGSAGMNYWQWYIWTGRDGIYYDYGGGTDKTYNGLFLIGGNPGNVAGAAAELAGTTTTSKAKLIANGVEYDFIVNINYSSAKIPNKATGSGNLTYITEDGEEVTTTSKYEWLLHETEGLKINVEINTEEWQETGDWAIGYIGDLTQDVVTDVLGFDPGTLDNDHFYAVDADGVKIDWSSYAPGMWLNTDGSSSDWSTGVAYWQWYVRADQYYDYGYENYPYIFIFGGNPGNVSKIEFDTPFVSKAVMVSPDGAELPVEITYTFHDVILPEYEPYPRAIFEETGTMYPYGGGVDGNHTIQWYFDEEGLTVDVDAYLPTIRENGDWVFTAATIPTEVVTAYLGIEDIEQLYDIAYFYPLNADGTPSDAWTSYAPGEWYDATGNPCAWSDGHMYWWYQWGEHKYEGHFTEGLFVVGTNPDNVLDDEVVVGKAKLGDKLLTVKVTFHAAYPTAKEGKVGPFSYSWNMTETGMAITSNVSLASADESWAWMGFFINEAYINAKYDVDIAQLATSIETFYPTTADGTPYEKWSSYIPGEWFMEDGSEGAWNTGVSFWQYYTSNYADLGSHDFEAPNLFYVGKNPSYEFHAGSYVSKAKFSDYDFTFTINIAE